MATFISASQAIDAALACHDAASQTAVASAHRAHAINLAARVCAASAPGEVLVSETVRALARTSAGVRFEDRGLHHLKGIEEPQHLFAVVAP